MTRTVQLELTLDVEVEAKFINGAWNTTRIKNVYIEGQQHSVGGEYLDELLLANDRICERLAELYEQQEP